MSDEIEEQAFLAEIHKTGERLAILMYADWLEDQGDERAFDLRKYTDGLVEDPIGEFEHVFEELTLRQQVWLAANGAERSLPIFAAHNTESAIVANAIGWARRYATDPDNKTLRRVEFCWRDAHAIGWLPGGRVFPRTSPDGMAHTMKETRWMEASYLAAQSDPHEKRYRDWIEFHAKEVARWQLCQAQWTSYFGLLPFAETDRRRYFDVIASPRQSGS